MHPEGANGRTAVALLTERRYLGQRQPRGLASELRRRGCNVAIVEPDAGAVTLTDHTWLGQIDACVARGRSEAVLACLLAAERHGIPTVNRHAAIAAVHDKAAHDGVSRGGRHPHPADEPRLAGTAFRCGARGRVSGDRQARTGGQRPRPAALPGG